MMDVVRTVLFVWMYGLLATLTAGGHVEPPQVAYACEGSMLTIECPTGRLISVRSALFGRRSPSICGDNRNTAGWNLDCMSTKAVKIITDSCDSMVDCAVPASVATFGDPCLRTPKYLEVNFHCVPNITVTKARPTTVVTTTFLPSTAVTTQPTTVPLKVTTQSSKALPHVGQLLPCAAQTVRDVHWPETSGGDTVTMACPNNHDAANAQWTCGADGHWVDKPNLSQCTSAGTDAITSKLKKAKVAPAPDAAAVTEVAGEISKRPLAEPMYGGDVSNLAKAMREVVDMVDVTVHDVGDTAFVSQVNEAVVNTTSQLLTDALKDSWMDMPQSDQAHAATEMISAVEKSAFQLADTIDTPRVVIKMDINVVMEVNVVDTRKDLRDVEFPKYDQSSSKWKGNSMKLSSKTIKDLGLDGLAKLVFLMYNNLDELLQPEQVARDTKTSELYSSDDSYAELKGPKETYYKPADSKETADKGDGNDDKLSDKDYGEKEIPTTTAKMLEEMTTVPPREEGVKTIVNSKIVSASIGDANTTYLSEPVIYTLEHKTTENVFNPSCSFWDYSEKTMTGRWSHFGCHVLETNTTHTTCSCRHLTNFAILMDVHATPIGYYHSFILTLITYAGCIVSLVCLFISILTFHFCRSLQGDRNTIHKNLSICLFVANLIFILGIMRTDNWVMCAVIAGLLHYFFLAAFVWMLLEGVQLYFMLVQVFESERGRNIYFYVSGYGIPAIIVGVTAAIVPTAYGTKDFCWLAVDQGAIWAFVGPVAAILAINVVMFVIAICTMCRHKANSAAWYVRQKPRLESIRTWTKGAAVLIVLLGLTWSFGLLYINKHTLIFAYLFTIFNSLQGVFIFVFHCLTNEKVQKEYKQWVRKSACMPDCTKVKYGGATPASSAGSPNQYSEQSNNPMLRRVSKLFSSKKHSTSSLSSSVRKSTLSDPKYTYQNAEIANAYKSSNRESSRPILMDADAPETTLPSDNMNNYLEPATGDHTYAEIDETYQEISYIDGSIVDTNNLYNWGTGRSNSYQQPPQRSSGHTEPLINIDKYIIKKPSVSSENHPGCGDKRHSGESAFCDGGGHLGDEDLAENSDDDKIKDGSDRVSNDSNYDSLRRQKSGGDTRKCLNDLNRSSTASDSHAVAALNIFGDSSRAGRYTE